MCPTSLFRVQVPSGEHPPEGPLVFRVRVSSPRHLVDEPYVCAYLPCLDTHELMDCLMWLKSLVLCYMCLTRAWVCSTMNGILVVDEAPRALSGTTGRSTAGESDTPPYSDVRRLGDTAFWILASHNNGSLTETLHQASLPASGADGPPCIPALESLIRAI